MPSGSPPCPDCPYGRVRASLSDRLAETWAAWEGVKWAGLPGACTEQGRAGLPSVRTEQGWAGLPRACTEQGRAGLPSACTEQGRAGLPKTQQELCARASSLNFWVACSRWPGPHGAVSRCLRNYLYGDEVVYPTRHTPIHPKQQQTCERTLSPPTHPALS